MGGRKTFVLHASAAAAINRLSDEDAGALFKGLFSYVETGAEPALSPLAQMAFAFMRDVLDRDAEKYASTCRRRAEAGRRGGVSSGKSRSIQSEANEAIASKTKQTKQKQHDSDSDSDSDSESPSGDLACAHAREGDAVASGVTDDLLTCPAQTGERAALTAWKKQSVSEQRFDQFWLAYPKKVGKGAALTAWKKSKIGEALFAKVMTAVAQQAKSEQWRRESGRYIPNPERWLLQARWEDEATVLEPQTSAAHTTTYDLEAFERSTLEVPVYVPRKKAERYDVVGNIHENQELKGEHE
jgi:hypothetical protein